MLFNSPGFIFLFLPITLLVCYGLAARSQRSAILWLVAASAFFYGWFNVKLLLLLGLSIAFNFYFGRKLASDRKAARSLPIWLALGVFANISVLAYFKYTNFLIDNANLLFGTSYVLQNILLPIGISFFTFQKIAYLVDTYRGEAEEYDFLSFCLFVLYFPQLIAGPIVHHKDIVPQFRGPLAFRYSPGSFAAGMTLFSIGLFKKVIIADNMAQISDPVFATLSSGATPDIGTAWSGALGFTFQIYFDFSGYTDMALGLALMCGIRLPLNFDSPYKATSIIEFWQRWHMSLSKFIRDYVYISLGGNRRGIIRRYVNLMLTMLIGGLWHGAAWTFVAWGGLHGLYLIVNHGWRRLCGKTGSTGESGPLVRWTMRLLTFSAVVIAWVFFRADSFQSAWLMLQGMTGFYDISGAAAGLGLISWQRGALFVALLGWVFLLPNSHEFLGHMQPALQQCEAARVPFWVRPVAQRLGLATAEGAFSLGAMTGVSVALLVMGIVIYQSFRNAALQQFIYFQF